MVIDRILRNCAKQHCAASVWMSSCSVLHTKRHEESSSAIAAKVRKEMAEPRMSRSARMAELKLDTRRRPHASNPPVSIEKSRVSALDDEPFRLRNRWSVSITVAAENHSSSNAPRHEMRPAKGLEFNCAEPFSRDGITRETPVARHQASKQGRPNGNGK
jgi:hypothetical protein